jgi:hypothetical protein
VLALLAEGRTDRQIAEALFISPGPSPCTCPASTKLGVPNAAGPPRSRTGTASAAERRAGAVCYHAFRYPCLK